MDKMAGLGAALPPQKKGGKKPPKEEDEDEEDEVRVPMKTAAPRPRRGAPPIFSRAFTGLAPGPQPLLTHAPS